MRMATVAAWLKRGTVRYIFVLVLLVAAVEGGAIGMVAMLARDSHQSAKALETRLNLHPVFHRLDPPGKPILHPRIEDASRAKIPPGEPVIGVEVGGTARAYRLAAFEDQTSHLVSDRLGNLPVLVSYCNISHCARVFTDAEGKGPFDVEVAGLLQSEMVIKVGKDFYYQKSGAPIEPANNPPTIPYPTVEPTLTTWKNWQRVHPETDVYLGEQDSPGQ